MTAPTRTRSRVHSQRSTTASARDRARRRDHARTPERDRSKAARQKAARQSTVKHSPAVRGRTSAAQKAYARRAQRTEAKLQVPSGQQPGKGVLSMLKLRLPASRASFVVLVMALLTGGVVLTLWLSTQAIADSYRLESIRAETAGLAERAERLQREVARQESAAVLAQKAKALGMVPSGEPARLLVTPHGKPKLFGEPKVVARPRPPAPPPPKKKQRATQDDQRTDDGTERARPAEEDQQAQAQAAPAPDADDGAEGAEGGQ